MVCEEIYRYSTAPPGGHQPELNLQVVEEIPGSRRRSQDGCHEALHNRCLLRAGKGGEEPMGSRRKGPWRNAGEVPREKSG